MPLLTWPYRLSEPCASLAPLNKINLFHMLALPTTAHFTCAESVYKPLSLLSESYYNHQSTLCKHINSNSTCQIITFVSL